MNRALVVATALSLVLIALGLHGVVVLLRQHTIDARRAGPLVHRRRRRPGGHLPARLDLLQLMIGDALGGAPNVMENLADHLGQLGADAPDPVTPGPMGPAHRRAQWLDGELERLAHAYDLQQYGRDD
jgi:hypothetical protein